MDEGLKILAVDNEPAVTLSMRYIFDGPRYQLTTVGDGQTALARLAAAGPDAYDVIIVDQKMPAMSGTELVTEIRQRGIAGGIIVVSAHLSSSICEAYEHLGVQVMLSKPFDVDILRNAVEQVAA